MKYFFLKFVGATFILFLSCIATPTAFAATINSISTSSPSTLQNGLVGWWTMDGVTTNWATGQTLDNSGQGNNGQMVSMSTSTSPVQGKTGQALKFNGTSQYIKDPGAFNFTSQNFSISYWVKLNSLTTDVGGQGPVTIYKGAFQTKGYYQQIGTDGAVHFATNQAGAIQSSDTSAGTLSTGIWYLITDVRNGSSVRIYVNGTDVTTSAGSHSDPLTSSDDFQVGLYSTTIHLNGVMDDVRVYNRALSTTEVQQLYNTGAGVNTNASTYQGTLASGLTAYWNLDSSSISGTSVTDASGNGITGTTAGSPTTGTGEIAQALSLNGTTQYVSFSASGSANIGASTKFSVSLWTQVPSLPVGSLAALFDERNASNATPAIVYIDTSNHIRFYRDYVGTSDLISNATLSAGKWYHITALWDGSYRYIYINGVLDNSMADSNNTTATSATFGTLGALSNGSGTRANFLPGSLDDARLYTRVLSPSEIKQLYGLGYVGPQSTLNNSSLVGHWTLDGNDTDWKTGKTNDTSGQGNMGQMIAMSTSSSSVQGQIGQALSFNGSTQYVNGGAGSSLTGTGAFTVAGWVKFAGTGDYTMVSRITDASNNAVWDVETFNGNIYLGVTSNGIPWSKQIHTTTTYNDGKWHHVVATYNPSTKVEVFVDGVSQVSNASSIPASLFTSSNPIYIGTAFTTNNTTPLNPFLGSIDDVRFYNRVLSTTEIQQLYNTGAGTHFNVTKTLGTPTSNLVGLWTFDGTAVNWTTGKVLDNSGQGNNGQMTNLATTTGVGAGALGQAINFNGSSSYIAIPGATYRSLQSGTISFWCRAGEGIVGGVEFATSHSGANNRQFNFTCDTQPGVTAVSSDGATIYYISHTTATIPKGWHMITYTSSHGAGSFTYYVDGVAQPMTVTFGSNRDVFFADVMQGTDDLQLGAKSDVGHTHVTFASGKLDDVRIYNRVLSATEVMQLYRRGL